MIGMISEKKSLGYVRVASVLIYPLKEKFRQKTKPKGNPIFLTFTEIFVLEQFTKDGMSFPFRCDVVNAASII